MENFKHPNICIIGDLREKSGGQKKIFEETVESIHWEDLTVLNVYTSNNKTLKYMKQKLIGLQG